MNYSKQREALLRLLRSTDTHPTAEWLYSRLRVDFPNISMGTVYRNLAQLSERGDILKLSVGEGSVRYDGFTGEHCHFVCRECGRVYDIEEKPDIGSAVERTTGFSIESSAVTFYGKCLDCKRGM